jgi:hypothetical protein
MSVTATLGDTEVHALLQPHSNSMTRVELTGGDKLIATAKGKSVRLSSERDVFSGEDGYGATLQHLEPGDKVRIELQRKSGERASGEATIPAAFHIDAPRKDQTFAVDESVTFKWSGGAPGERMDLEYSGKCDGSRESGTVPGDAYGEDDGSSSGVVIDTPYMQHSPDSCSVDVHLIRVLAGTVAGAWSADIEGRQQRSVHLFFE